jgi:hypothetical protein
MNHPHLRRFIAVLTIACLSWPCGHIWEVAWFGPRTGAVFRRRGDDP